jgi:hypothetical protein
MEGGHEDALKVASGRITKFKRFIRENTEKSWRTWRRAEKETRRKL